MEYLMCAKLNIFEYKCLTAVNKVKVLPNCILINLMKTSFNNKMLALMLLNISQAYNIAKIPITGNPPEVR